MPQLKAKVMKVLKTTVIIMRTTTQSVPISSNRNVDSYLLERNNMGDNATKCLPSKLHRPSKWNHTMHPHP